VQDGFSRQVSPEIPLYRKRIRFLVPTVLALYVLPNPQQLGDSRRWHTLARSPPDRRPFVS
jgi:hypothetical protein